MIRPCFCASVLTAALVAQTPAIQEGTLRGHMAFLADDLLEGRGPGTRGGYLAAKYLETQLQILGMKPANGTSYLQAVPLVGLRTVPERTKLVFRGLKGPMDFSLGEGYLVGAGEAAEEVKIAAPLVFVGHGVTLEGRDDFKGVDVRGKIVLAVVGPRPDQEPGCCTPSHYSARWAFKIAQARKRGAAGVLLIHESAQAGYDWRVVKAGWTIERVHRDPLASGAALQGWLSNASARALFAAAGLDFDALRKEADTRDFHPRTLEGVSLSGVLASEVRRFQDWNVAGVLPGTDPELAKEAVIYSAHWDHLGVDRRTGRTLNGAVDNASGCGGVLAIAQAMVGKPTRRSQMFFFPAVEEPGLLGAEAFVAHPLWPLDKIVAVLNLESLNFAGPTRDIGLAGSEGNTLRDIGGEVAQRMGLKVTPSKPDPAGLFFRSDHFPFVKAGVPAFSPGFSLDGGWDYIHEQDGLKAKDYVAKHYHQSSDRYDPQWDLRGMMQQIQFIHALGVELGNRADRPVWKGPARHW
ncbi:MAG: M28 family peptidase [Firmicutes bacterium]|nr:M28 family peptidase [Bacillota bacterium]